MGFWRDENHTALSITNLEPDISHDKMAKKGFKRLDKKVNINIVHHRHRKADPGGISYKAAIDGIVNAKILSDDSAKEIEEIRERQEKIPTSKPEITVITIRELKDE